MTFTDRYLTETSAILGILDANVIERMAEELSMVRASGGRVVVIGVGGSAATASHAVNDFRKLARIDAYAPTDNVAELTARTNDDGWDSTFVNWLSVFQMDNYDALFVLSVGGGSKWASQNIVRAVNYAWYHGASIYGVVGRDGGHTATLASECLVIPPIYEDRITPHTEGICSIIMHLLVSHPALR